MKKVIQVKNLTKKYKNLIAVNNISFNVEKGEIFGLLGENGAGKTTALEMIEGIRKPNSGKISILGLEGWKDATRIKEKIGVQLQSSAYYNFLTLEEILKLFGGFYSKAVDPQNLLGNVDLGEKSKSYVGSLSGGQKQRFSIVASLVNNPEIVFLDEPTTGLDPLARRNLWGLISKIKQDGKTVILTTHYMEEAETLCDRIAIMDKGNIIAMGETHKLIEESKEPYKIHFTVSKIDNKLFAKIIKIGNIYNLMGRNKGFELKLKTRRDLNQALKIIQKMNPESITVGRATLEDLFIELTGKTILE